MASRTIVLITDGCDNSSQTKFGKALEALQDGNIVLYVLQVPDRTHGALQRDKPKPQAVLDELTKGTGGTVFQFAKAADARKDHS